MEMSQVAWMTKKKVENGSPRKTCTNTWPTVTLKSVDQRYRMLKMRGKQAVLLLDRRCLKKTKNQSLLKRSL